MALYIDPVNQAFIDAGAKAGKTPLYELSHVVVAIFRCDGRLHDFVMLNSTAVSPTARAAIEMARLKLKQALA
jgi:hypothetical protein